MSNSSYMLKESSSLAPLDKPLELNEEEKLISASLTPSPTYTLTDKWIMAHQRRKLATENKWVQKLQKADERIATCFNDLKVFTFLLIFALVFMSYTGVSWFSLAILLSV